MLNDVFVLDAICHAYNFRQRTGSASLTPSFIAKGVYHMHVFFRPPTGPTY